MQANRFDAPDQALTGGEWPPGLSWPGHHRTLTGKVDRLDVRFGALAVLVAESAMD